MEYTQLRHFAAVREVGLPQLALAWTLANTAVGGPSPESV
jgi:hypothetical protein